MTVVKSQPRRKVALQSMSKIVMKLVSEQRVNNPQIKIKPVAIKMPKKKCAAMMPWFHTRRGGTFVGAIS